jgi:hypothetical protein
VFAACGAGPAASSLRRVRAGAGVHPLYRSARGDYHGVTGVWALALRPPVAGSGSAPPPHELVVVSFVAGTRGLWVGAAGLRDASQVSGLGDAKSSAG